MADQQAPPAGPDLSLGVTLSEFSGATLLGHVGDDEVLLVRSGAEIFAIDAHCSHYGGPLAEGLVVGGTVRCPWHHACFDLRTGEALRAPALNPIPTYDVERVDGRVRVVGKREERAPEKTADGPSSVLIVGAGAAGEARGGGPGGAGGAGGREEDRAGAPRAGDPAAPPPERVLGPEIGDFVRALHEEHGVVFHLEKTVESISASSVTLSGGEVLGADLVAAGIGVRPAVALAQAAGLALDHGILVDERLETSAKGVFAAGDVARFRDARTGQAIRVEHWVVAERMGQAAA